MKFGLFFLAENRHHDFQRSYEELLDQVEYAESLGFDSVWLAEHHGSDYGPLPRPAVMAAAIAERTQRMRIGIAVSILPFDHPVRIAEDWAMVDVISGGRLDFGVGRGYQPHEYKMLGLADRQAVSREVFAESLDVIRGLWTTPAGKTFSYHGRHFDIDEADTRPDVVQKPHPPLYVATFSPETFGLVADEGHNMLMTPTIYPLETLTEMAVDAKRKCIANGRAPLSLDFPLLWQMHLAETEEQAVRDIDDPFAWYFNTIVAKLPQGANVAKTYELYAQIAEQAKEAGGITIDAVRQTGGACVGTPQSAAEEIEKLHDQMGLQTLICWMQIGGMDSGKVKSSMKLFAEQVMPQFRDRPPVVPAALR